MSKWMEIRDDIEAEVSEMKIDEQVKQTVTQKLYDVALPEPAEAWRRLYRRYP